jgi:hypothetical protein
MWSQKNPSQLRKGHFFARMGYLMKQSTSAMKEKAMTAF